jgi:glutamine cyclotransferase
MKIFTALLLSLPGLQACTNNESGNKDQLAIETTAIPVINYALLSTYPHDTASFTEGLLVNNGQLYESTGSPENMPQTRSLFGILDTTTGMINKKVELDRKQYFGEGIVFLNNKVYQLTYQNEIGFIYDAATFEKSGQFAYPGKEGWGMTTDSTFLIISDGSNILYYVDPLNFKTIKTIQVEDETGRPVMKLNELEYISHHIYANVYETNSIIKIEPATGKITGVLDLTSLAHEAKTRYRGSMEMNGIAYDPVTSLVYISGKMWPVVYKIHFPH